MTDPVFFFFPPLVRRDFRAGAASIERYISATADANQSQTNICDTSPALTHHQAAAAPRRTLISAAVLFLFLVVGQFEAFPIHFPLTQLPKHLVLRL